MNNLSAIIKIAKQRQKLADEAIYKAVQSLKEMCGDNQKAFEEAEEEMLLYIYDGTDTHDNKITLSKLIKDIESING